MLDFLKRKKPTELATPQKPLIIDCSVRDDVNLGDLAKEKVTGFTGIVTAISYEIDGTVFVGLQPRDLEDGKPAESLEFDIERIEVIERGVAKTNDTAEAQKSVRIGAIYRDLVTGFQGTAIRRIDFIGGCVRVTLVGKVDKDNKTPDPLMVAVERLELIDVKPAEVAEKKATRTGGPGSSDQRMLGRLNSR